VNGEPEPGVRVASSALGLVLVCKNFFTRDFPLYVYTHYEHPFTLILFENVCCRIFLLNGCRTLVPLLVLIKKLSSSVFREQTKTLSGISYVCLF
jgi:hypothetical protein